MDYNEDRFARARRSSSAAYRPAPGQPRKCQGFTTISTERPVYPALEASLDWRSSRERWFCPAWRPPVLLPLLVWMGQWRWPYLPVTWRSSSRFWPKPPRAPLSPSVAAAGMRRGLVWLFAEASLLFARPALPCAGRALLCANSVWFDVNSAWRDAFLTFLPPARHPGESCP